MTLKAPQQEDMGPPCSSLSRVEGPLCHPNCTPCLQFLQSLQGSQLGKPAVGKKSKTMILTSSESEFWRSVYIATIGRHSATRFLDPMSEADKALDEYQRRIR